MKPETQTTQAIFTKFKEYNDVIPIIVNKVGLFDKLENVDEIDYFRFFIDRNGTNREVDGHVLSKSGKIILWFELKLDQDFDEEQLLMEYEALKNEAKNKNYDYLLIGVSDHLKKPGLFIRRKKDGFKYEWLSYEHIRRAFKRFAKSQDERTKLIIKGFLTEFFRQPFNQFNKVHFNFISDSIESLPDIEDFGEKCASVDRQINDFIESLRKTIGKNYKVSKKPVCLEWGRNGIVKLSIPERAVVNI